MLCSPEEAARRELRMIDTTNLNEHDMIETVAKKTLKIFEQKVKEGENA